MLWFFSDPHYSHKNIIRGLSDWNNKNGCRNFDSFQAHNDWLVETINAKVAPNDVLWCLGDWSFGGEHRIREFRERLNCGTVHLVLGNHDHHCRKEQDTPWHYGFESIQDYKELQAGKIQLVLFHYPIESWTSMERGAIHLHGHTHKGEPKKAGRYNVGVDIDKGCLGLVSLDDIATLPRANDRRHAELNGGNAFGS